MRRIKKLFTAVLFILSSYRMGCLADKVVNGTVTFTTSRSIYLALDQTNSVKEGDTVLAGTTPGELRPVIVKSVSPRKLVIENDPALSEITGGSPLYVRLPSASLKSGETQSDNRVEKDKNSVKSLLFGNVMAHSCFLGTENDFPQGRNPVDNRYDTGNC